MNNNFYIYIYLDSRYNGQYCYNDVCFLYKPFYIGKGKNGRYKEINNRNDNFIEIMNDIEKSGLESIVFKLYENLSEEKSFELETKSINEIGRIDLGTGFLINKTSGGQGKNGYKYSKEIREIISEKKRKNFTEIIKKFEERYCTLLTKENEYRNVHQKLKYICPNNHQNFVMFANFKKENYCPVCWKEKQKGEYNPNHKLTEDQVVQIKLLLKEGILTQQEIADMFGISRSVISKIKNGKLWNNIGGDL
jgi:predicted XRE-type DNA-binding protein